MVIHMHLGELSPLVAGQTTHKAMRAPVAGRFCMPGLLEDFHEEPLFFVKIEILVMRDHEIQREPETHWLLREPVHEQPFEESAAKQVAFVRQVEIPECPAECQV